MNNTELQKLLEDVCETLEKSVEGLKITSAAVTQEHLFVVCFFYEGMQGEDAVYLMPSVWPKLSFFDLCQVLIEQIHQTNNPVSDTVH